MIIFNYDDPFVPEPIDDIPLTPFEYKALCRSYRPDWEARYSVVSVDSWHYVYRSGIWLKKLKYELSSDGLYHITEHYTTQKEQGNNIFRDQVLMEGYFEPRLWTTVLRSQHKLPAIQYHPKQVGDENFRFSLIQEGTRTINVIGLNPSTATDSMGDQTMKKVLGFARCNGYDGFAMFNLCPIRATNPDDLPMQIDKNLCVRNIGEIVPSLCGSYLEILLAFGDNVTKRPYFLESFKELMDALKDKNCKFYQIGSLTPKGFPRHPLYEPYSFFNEYRPK